MTPKERMRAAMAGGEPDRVPVMCQLSIGHMLLQTGIPPLELWMDKDRFAEALLRLRALYGFDGILVSLHGHDPDWRAGVAESARDGAEETVRWQDGSRTVFPADDLPRPGPESEIVPLSILDFDPDSLPGVPDYIPVSQGLRFRIDPNHPWDVFRTILERAGEEYSIHGEVTSPLDYFLDLFGFAGGLLALAEEPGRCQAVLSKLTDGIVEIARRQAALGLDAIKISSPYAGAGFISPRYYREFVLPFERRIAAAVRGAGAFAYTHTCGAIGDRLEMMAETGISGLECLDPPPLGNVELADAKARVGGRLFIKGNIDPVHTLLFGTRDDIRRDALARLEVGARGGGFILSTACSIAPHTPRENVALLAGLAAEIGNRRRD